MEKEQNEPAPRKEKIQKKKKVNTYQFQFVDSLLMKLLYCM